MKICVYAFANTAHFFARLIEKSRAMNDCVAWTAIVPRWQHRERMESLLPERDLLYLYDDFDARYADTSADAAFALGPDADNELLCLLKDKGGYRQLDGREQLRRVATVTAIYREFLERVRPDYMVFPDLEVVDGFLLLSLCRSLGIVPIYYVGMRVLDGGFLAPDCYETLPRYFGPYDAAELERARAFVAGYLADVPTLLEPLVTERPVLPVTAPLWRRTPRALLNHWRHERRYVGEDGWVMRIKANVAGPLNAFRAAYFRRFQLRWFDLISDLQPLPPKYVLYALQYTPESSINGLEPYYVDQLRAIDLLLAGMPSDCRLVVKEHPAIVGVRSDAYYRELRRKPGLLLAAPGLSTRRLMERAAAVASVTGTIGLECYLRGIPCLLFGRNFFSHLCASGEGPSSIRQVLANLLSNFRVPSLEKRSIELARLLHVRYPIELSDPLVRPLVLSDRNVSAFLEAVHDHIARLGSPHLVASD